MSGIEVSTNPTMYSALVNSTPTGRVSLISLRTTGGSTGNGTATDRGPVIDYAVAGTTEASAYGTHYTGGALGGVNLASISFSKPFKVFIPGLSATDQAETTGRIIFGGNSVSSIGAIDNTNWGIELAFINGSVICRAVKSAAGTVLVTTGVVFTDGDCIEVRHSPSTGLELYMGAHPGALAIAASIGFDANNYPNADSVDGQIRVGIIRAGGTDTTARYFTVCTPWITQYNGG